MSESGGGTPAPAAAASAGDVHTHTHTHTQHAHSFKLRFAAQREPGRSYVSLVKPLGLPATVTGKFYSCAPAPEGSPERRAQRRIRDLFALAPRDYLSAPLTESQQYGWWGGAGEAATDARLRHHIRDSAWLKARLLVLAADDKLKRN